MPRPDFFLVVERALEPNIAHGAVTVNFLAASKELRWHPVDLELMNKIVFVGEKTDSPEQAGGSSFGACLNGHFDFPFRAVLIDNVKLRVRAGLVFLGEGHLAVRFVIFPTRAIKEVL